MIPEEFKTQIFKTQNQWDSGLTYRLEKLEGGGITLYSTPTFDRWIQEPGWMKNPGALAVDECGQVYILDGDTCKLYRYDPEGGRTEHIPYIGGCGSDPGKFKNPGRIIFDTFTIWVLDAGNRRVQAFSREDYQIKYIIENLKEPVDIGLDEQGYLYVIDDKGNHVFKILKFDVNGQIVKNTFEDSCLKDPAALAIGRESTLYVIDRKHKGFIRFTDETCTVPLGDFSKIFKYGVVPGGFKPSDLSIDRKGNIFVVESGIGRIHQFDLEGNFIGTITIPKLSGPIRGIAVDVRGNLYAGGDKGIASLITRRKYTKEIGVYYSKTMDSGIQDCQWHRLAMDAEIPQRSVLEISFYSSDDEELKKTIDELLSDSRKTIRQKVSSMEDEIPWIGPERYYSSDDPRATDGAHEQKRRDMLLKGKSGRYLWLKITLLTFDENVRPAISQMRVFYPRSSYLRYLPAIYQEDPKSKEFLERFLSLFETVFYDLETEISHVFKYFDPETSPQNFLTWLASWMKIALEEDWPEDKKRKFIQEASSLYKLKGTPSGIEKLIEIYTGKKPLIQELSRIGKPMVLIGTGAFKLGLNSLLIETPVRGFRLGDDSILGRTALRDVVQSPGDPFLPLAHRFIVILDLSTDVSYAKGVERILNDQKPAHTTYTLRGLNETKVGMSMYVGINTRVGDYRPICIEKDHDSAIYRDSTVGSSIIVTGERQGSRVGRRSRLGTDVELI